MYTNDNQHYAIKVPNEKWQIFWQENYEKSLLLFITGRCNLNCTNCFSISNRNTIEMSLGDVEKVIEANPEYDKIDLMGGEPLLHSQINEIIQNLQSRNKRVSIYTNGILLTKIQKNSPLRVCVSFHEIFSESGNRKPLCRIIDDLSFYANAPGHSLKLVLLIDRINIDHIFECVNYVDEQLPFVNTLTIGLMRNENDYWNDNYTNVVAFNMYAEAIQCLIDTYEGRLNLDIFTKGVLTFDGDTNMDQNRVNRFKCIFQDLTFSDCLYNACDSNHPALPESCKLPDSLFRCKHTGRVSCLADKVRLIRKKG